MAHLFVSDTGLIKKRTPGSTTTTAVSLPADVALRAFSTWTDHVLMQGIDRLLLVGRWNAPLIWIPSLQRLWKAGIIPPASEPTLATNGTGITGTAIGVYTFAEITGDRIIHESNPSPGSNTLSLSNQGRRWSGLPTTHSNPRVTHKRLYVSMDGDDYLFVANVPLGDATYDEAVATASLGDAVNERRGVPPTGAIYVTMYHRRAWYADGSDTIWYSEIDEPESVHVANTMKTEDARAITMLRGMTDQLIIGTRTSFGDLQGWGGAEGSADFAMRIITQGIGCISNRGSRVVNDKLWFPSQEGYYRYGSGGFQFLMKNLRTYFRTAYEADPETYEGMQCAIDRRKHTLNILVPGEAADARAPFYYIAHYLPCELELGGTGELPYWTFDTRAVGRYDTAVGELTEGDRLDRLYSGACDGIVRLEGVNGEDDDGIDITSTITLKHFYMGDQSGDDSHAHTFDEITFYVKSQSTSWTPSAYVGDDDVANAASPSWAPLTAIPAGLQTKNGNTAVARTSKHFKIERAGKGCTPKIVMVNANGFEFRGLSINFSNHGEQPPPAIAG